MKKCHHVWVLQEFFSRHSSNRIHSTTNTSWGHPAGELHWKVSLELIWQLHLNIKQCEKLSVALVSFQFLSYKWKTPSPSSAKFHSFSNQSLSPNSEQQGDNFPLCYQHPPLWLQLIISSTRAFILIDPSSDILKNFSAAWALTMRRDGKRNRIFP